MSKLFFFRHGQASAGSENYDQLSEKGKEQARLLGGYLCLEDIKFDRIFCGPLVRQKETEKEVRLIYQSKNRIYPHAEVLDGLREHTGMDILKTHYKAILQQHPYLEELRLKSQENPAQSQHYYMQAFDYFMQKWALEELNIEGIPLWRTFRKEVKTALDTILNATKKGETVGVFTSGGTISAIVGECLGIDKEDRIAQLNYSVRNASITQFLYADPKFSLLEFNALHFLPKEMITFV